MLRVVGLALLFVIGAAAPAEANERDAKGAAVAAQRGPASSGAKLGLHERITPDQLTKPSQIAPPPLRGRFSIGLRHDLINRTAPPAALAPEARARGKALSWPWVSQARSGLRLPATERLSFAVGYRHLEGEDLWRRYGEAGSVDYDSHDFMLRASWRF